MKIKNAHKQMNISKFRSIFWLLLIALVGCASQPMQPPRATAAPTYEQVEPLGVGMEGWIYPYPVLYLQFEQQGHLVRMAYMDVQASVKPNGRTVILLHGKNFGADYWENTIRTLSAQGYRVIAPDQIGFGKSSKPEIRYTFADLTDNNVRLLDHLGVSRVAVIANSMGGMLGVHFASRYPQRVSGLVLENPLGLEEYVPAIPKQSTQSLQKQEMAQTTESYRSFIKSYFKDNYRPEFERFVEQFSRVQRSSEYPRYALVSALTYQMIYDGSIYNELSSLRVPVLLTIGQLDRTVFGRRFAPPDVVKGMGYFPQLGKDAQKRIPDARLVELKNVGHVPHLEAPERFHAVVLQFLNDKQ
jgi:pimeloyl-ACP methyl ester carboxylesterase